MVNKKIIFLIQLVVKNGEYVEWDQNGKKISEGVYKSGEKWSGYFGDDHYINGIKGLLFLEFFKNGN